MAESIVGRDGRRWVVRRRWMPRLGTETLWGRFHRRFRKVFERVGDAADVDPGCGELLGEGNIARRLEAGLDPDVAV